MSVMVKIFKVDGINTGVLNKMIKKKVGDVWEYPITKPSGVRNVSLGWIEMKKSRMRIKRYFGGKMPWRLKNIRVGSGLCIKVNSGRVVQVPGEDEKYYKILVDDVSAQILKDAGFEVDDFGFWYVDKSIVLDVLEIQRRVWND